MSYHRTSHWALSCTSLLSVIVITHQTAIGRTPGITKGQSLFLYSFDKSPFVGVKGESQGRRPLSRPLLRRRGKEITIHSRGELWFSHKGPSSNQSCFKPWEARTLNGLVNVVLHLPLIRAQDQVFDCHHDYCFVNILNIHPCTNTNPLGSLFDNNMKKWRRNEINERKRTLFEFHYTSITQ